jgi:hypothetical protein
MLEIVMETFQDERTPAEIVGRLDDAGYYAKLVALARHLLETMKSVRPLTRDEILDRLAIVLAESRGEPSTRTGKQ